MELRELEKRILRNKGWFWQDNDIVDVYGKHLGAIGLCIYQHLARRANKETQESFPSQETIARDCGCTSRTIRNHIDKLVYYNLIFVIKERRRGGYRRNRYLMIDKDYWLLPASNSIHKRKKFPIGEENKVKNERNYLPTKETKSNKTKKKEIVATDASTKVQGIDKFNSNSP